MNVTCSPGPSNPAQDVGSAASVASDPDGLPRYPQSPGRPDGSTELPPPPSPTRENGSLPPPQRPRDPFRWPEWFNRPRLSASGWLASIGAAMLLVASIVVVASRWETITAEVRFAGLVGALVATFFVAERARERLSTTATAIAVLAAGLTAPTAIAATATLGGEWPICLVIGGIASLVATEVQARRWQVKTLTAATAVAAGVLATGLAALVHMPVQLIGAVLALGAMLVGARRRSIVLSAAVAAAPLFSALHSGFGSGTVMRVGLAEDDVSWAGPIATVVVAYVVGATALRAEDRRLAVLSHALVATGSIVWLTTTQVAVPVRFMLPALLLASAAALALSGIRAKNVMSEVAADAVGVLSPLLGASCVAAPLIATIAVAVDIRDLASWVTPFLATFVALVVASVVLVRLDAHAGAIPVDVSVLGAIGAAVSALVVAGVPLALVAGSAAIGWIATTAATSWRSWRMTSLAHAVWIVTTAAASEATAGVIAALVVVAGGLLIVSLLASPSIRVVLFGTPSTVGITVLMLAELLDDTVALGVGIAVFAIAAAGVSVLFPAESNLAVLAGSLGIANVVVMLDADPVFVSLALLLLAGQVLAFGGVNENVDVRRVGIAGIVSSLASLWWTSGTNAWAIGAVELYGASGVDIAVGAIGLLLIGAGRIVQTSIRPSSWLAYGPGLAMTAAWLLARQVDADASWATFIGLLVGVVAISAGGVARLAAPLVIGTALTLGTLVVSAGPRFAEAPTWTWMAAGGVLLLIVAAMIERSERPLLPSDEQPGESLVETFGRRFE